MGSSSSMQKMPLYRGLWKPILFMGCERTPFMLVAITSACLVLEGGLWIKVFGIIYFIILIVVMAVINSKDPYYFQILWRYKSYQYFYLNNANYPGKPDNPNN